MGLKNILKAVVFLASLGIVVPVLAGNVNLPETGQLWCYDNAGNQIACPGSGQDGEIMAGASWPTPRFTNNGDGTLTDNLTGLMWIRNGWMRQSSASLSNAYHFIDDLNDYDVNRNDFTIAFKAEYDNSPKYTNWKLPNINEVASLFNAWSEDQIAWLQSQGFININNLQIWSSTTAAGSTINAWVANNSSFHHGQIATLSKNGSAMVLAVRGPVAGGTAKVWQTGQTTSYDGASPPRDDGQFQMGEPWPAPRFTDNGNGTVTDNLTNLVWLRDAGYFSASEWEAALALMADFRTNPQNHNPQDYAAGQQEWRLPNRTELFSLLDHENHSPPLQQGHPFVNVPSASVTTGTTVKGNKTQAWGVSFLTGGVVRLGKTFSQNIWPVYSIEPDTPGGDSDANNYGEAGNTNEPISTATGELYFEALDMVAGGPLPLYFKRYYASMLTYAGKIGTSLGNNWTHNFDLQLILDGANATVVNTRGRTVEFEKTGGDWSLKSPIPVIYQLAESGVDFKFMDPQIQQIFTFDATGKLTRIEDRNGNALTLLYVGSRLIQVSDGMGRMYGFTYTGDKLTTIEDQTAAPTVRSISFAYTGDNLTEYTDARGFTSFYEYTAAGMLKGLLTKTTRPENNTPYTQTWEGLTGKVSTQDDSNGNTLTMAYHTPSTDDTRVTDALGHSFEHVHQDFARLTEHRDQTGESFTMDYDASGRRIRIEDRLGDITETAYHAATGKISSYTNAAGDVTNITQITQVQGDFTFYNATRIDYPDGTHVEISHDANGNPTRFTDREDNIWTFTYNTLGQVLSVTNPEGGKTTGTYFADGTLETLTDHFNNLTRYAYDAYKRLQQVTLADGNTRSYSYDDNNNLLSITDELGRTTQFNYDKNNNPTTVTDAATNTNTYGYDGNDRVISLLDRLNHTSSFTYDELGRLKTAQNPAGETHTRGYNSRGWLDELTNPDGQTWSMTHDKEGVIASSGNPIGNTWHYLSDAMGRITRITTPLTHQHNYAYDALGRLTSYTDPLNKTTVFAYDNHGLVTGITLPGSISAAFTRNALGRITQIIDANGNPWGSTYDDAGRPTSRTDPLGNITGYEYNNRNQLSRIDLPANDVTFTYDDAGNIIRKRYSDTTEITYSYDDLNRLLTTSGLVISYDIRGGIMDSNGIGVTRDNAGRIQTMTLAPGKAVTYAYNSCGLVSQVADWAGGATTLVYDDAERLTTLVRPNGITTTYSYDNDNMVIGISEDNGGNISNIILSRNEKGEVTTANRNLPLTPDVTANTLDLTLTVNAASQITGYIYDAMGRLIDDGTRTYTWDLASRLSDYTEGSKTVTFEYDGLGMRIGRTQGGTTRTYVWNYAIDLPSVSVVKEGGVDLRYYIHLPGGWLLHSLEAADNNSRFYHYDEIGTTLFLTDEAGSLTDSYGVTPYGQVTGKTGTTDNPFVFIGAYGVMQEGTTDLYYIRARYYDSFTARFIAKDPIQSVHTMHMNPFQYAANNPMYYLEPSGTQHTTGIFGPETTPTAGSGVPFDSDYDIDLILFEQYTGAVPSRFYPKMFDNLSTYELIMMEDATTSLGCSGRETISIKPFVQIANPGYPWEESALLTLEIETPYKWKEYSLGLEVGVLFAGNAFDLDSDPLNNNDALAILDEVLSDQRSLNYNIVSGFQNSFDSIGFLDSDDNIIFSTTVQAAVQF